MRGAMKNCFKTILTLSLIAILILVGIIPVGPDVTFGQPKRKPAISSESRKDSFSLPSGIRPLSREVHVPENKIEDKKVTAMATPDIKPVEKPVEAPLKLKAILISDHVRLASIDRSIVTVGDSINGEKVLDIRPDRVILEKEGKKRTILLDQSPIKIIVEDR